MNELGFEFEHPWVLLFLALGGWLAKHLGATVATTTESRVIA